MRYLTILEVLRLHTLIIERSGGSAGIRDRGAVESLCRSQNYSWISTSERVSV